MIGLRARLLSAGLLALFGLGACSKSSDQVIGGGHHGRYVGIGTFEAGKLWSEMVVNDPPKDARAATTDDDEHIIVVVDSDTGEIRECGDYSGLCVSMNPWTKAIAGPQNVPVALTKHAADVRAEEHETDQPLNAAPAKPNPSPKANRPAT